LRDALLEARDAVEDALRSALLEERLVADDPLELDLRALVPELFFAAEDRFVVRLVPEERLLPPLDPEPELDDPLDDDPALLLGCGMVFSSFVDRMGPTAP
jgi:hypothetical protein